MKTIKQTILVLVVILATLSCKKDEVTDTQYNKDKIVGKWGLVAEFDSEEGASNLTDCDKKTTWDFTTSNQLIVEWFYDEGVGCESEGINTLSYNINENIISVSSGSEEDTAEILELTSSTLKVKFTDEGFWTYTFKKL